MTSYALLAVSHGTSSPAGQAAVLGLAKSVADAAAAAAAAHERRAAASVVHGDAPTDAALVRLAHVDVQQPDVAAGLAALGAGRPAVIVPLLLSAGYHVYVDLTDEVRASEGREVVLAGALGPDDRLVEVLAMRLAEAGATERDAIVLGVAGSSDARAVADCRDMGERMSARLGVPVIVGFLAAATPTLPDAVAEARATPLAGGELPERVIVSSYLLAPGYFQDLAGTAGADVLTDPLLVPTEPPPAALVDLVLDRFTRAAV